MEYPKLNNTQIAVLRQVAGALSVNPDWLYKLIDFESGWNPAARNPISTARGLIQFTDTTARGMGFGDADFIVEQYPEIESQLLTPVYGYLKPFAPFPSEQSLTMAVFYPAYRAMPLTLAFPDSVQSVNPGITTPEDYIKKVFGRDWKPYAAGAGAVIALVALSILTVLYFFPERGIA